MFVLKIIFFIYLFGEHFDAVNSTQAFNGEL
jgi:hypothetical protein